MILDIKHTPNDDVKCSIKIQHITESEVTLNNAIFIQLNRFIDEISPIGGSCAAKYITKILMLDKPCNALKILFDAIRDSSCNIDLYYRTKLSNSDININDISWIKADFNTEINGKLQENIPNPDNNSFKSYESTINNIPTFFGVQVKIVMKGGNPAKSPVIKNFKMIALDE